MIKIFKIKSFAYTPFDNPGDLEYLKSNGLIITNSPGEADILVSQNFRHLKKYFWQYRRKKAYMVWTLEPRFDTSFQTSQKILFGLHNCHFMNVYTGNVFTSAFTFHSHKINRQLDPLSWDFQLGHRKVAALMSYFKGEDSRPLYRNGKDIDLIKIRSRIGLEGHNRGIVDIYGKGWPEGLAIEDSRSGNWPFRKAEILNNYSFNLCFENTIAQNYITEKIWDSIENYCLPIYYGSGTGIYEVFPEESFIDYSKFVNPADLFDFVEKMKNDEFNSRLNMCIDIYNSISEQGESFYWNRRKESLDKIIINFNKILITSV